MCSCSFGIKYTSALNTDQYSPLDILITCHSFGETCKIKIRLNPLFYGSYSQLDVLWDGVDPLLQESWPSYD